MKEIGGYFEMDTYAGQEFYYNALALNCCRNAIAYIVEARQYERVYIPSFCCDSVATGVKKGGGQWAFYDVDERLRPQFSKEIPSRDAVLLVNYYGQLSNEEFLSYRDRFKNIIADNTQAFFQRPVAGVDTVYSCRKFFGVADGAYLATDARLNRRLETDRSASRMAFVLGRYEEEASKYYAEAAHNNESFEGEPVRHMSRLTKNLLRSIDYNAAARRRRENASFLHARLGSMNRLAYQVVDGAFMYPLWVERGSGAALRRHLQKERIYVPCLWPEVLEREPPNSLAYTLTDDIVPLPCDQRYGADEMAHIVKKVKDYFGG